jgi:hypothetical protein
VDETVVRCRRDEGIVMLPARPLLSLVEKVPTTFGDIPTRTRESRRALRVLLDDAPRPLRASARRV